MDHVTDSLLVGDADDASDHDAVRAAGVTVVLSLTHDSPATPARGYRIADHPLVDGPRNDADAFAAAADTLRSLLAEGECVLVHCSAGASRSVAVAGAGGRRLGRRGARGRLRGARRLRSAPRARRSNEGVRRGASRSARVRSHAGT
jgi:hypothetical protein